GDAEHRFGHARDRRPVLRRGRVLSTQLPPIELEAGCLAWIERLAAVLTCASKVVLERRQRALRFDAVSRRLKGLSGTRRVQRNAQAVRRRKGVLLAVQPIQVRE